LGGLFNLSDPNDQLNWEQTERAAQILNVRSQILDVRKSENLARAFDDAHEQRTNALVVSLNALMSANRRPIIELAEKYRLPTIYASREFVDAGGFVAYGVKYPDLYYRAAGYAVRILKGAKPAELPVEQPTKFELVINLKAAKALDLTVPPALLARADEVIE
jgi:putative ABC transport system substrate-binding protein